MISKETIRKIVKEALKGSEVNHISSEAINYLDSLCIEFCHNLTKNSIPAIYPKKTLMKEDLIACLDKRSLMSNTLPSGHFIWSPQIPKKGKNGG